MTTYHFVAASERFLTVEEPLEEVLRERQRNYAETGKTIDFWLVKQPAFLSSPDSSIHSRLTPLAIASPCPFSCADPLCLSLYCNADTSS